MKKPLYHGRTIIHKIETKNPIDLHLIDLGGKIYDASHILPEYFFISVPLFDDIIKQEIDEWLYIMKNLEVKEDFKSPYMKKVTERLSVLKMTAQEKDAYYRYMKKVLTQRDAITAAEKRAKPKVLKKVRAKKKLL